MNKIEKIKKEFNKAIETEKQEIETLKDKNLLIKIIKEIQKEGVVGEENTILALTNKIFLRLVKNAESTSSNVVVSDDSGAGKDWVVKNICKIIVPEDMYQHRTDLSPTVFKYWNADKKDFSWSGHVIHLEDPKEALIQGQTFKTMASGGTKVTITIDKKAVDLTTEGKPVMIVTSLKTTIDDEGGRRWDACRLDTSSKQTEIIKKKALERATGLIEYNPDLNLRHALQYLLRPKEVIIPFARELEDYLPNKLVIRTQINKLLDYIKSSAVLHQFNREKDSKGRVIANWFDYDYARFVFLHLKDEEGRALNKDEEEFIRVLRESGRPLPIKEISTKYDRHSTSWIYDHLEAFKSKKIIKESLEWDDDSQKKIKKIYATEEYEPSALSTSTWFYSPIPDVQESLQQESIPVFLAFSDICKDVNILRDVNGLYPIFIEIQENILINDDLTGVNGFPDDDKKTKECTGKPPLLDRLSSMKQVIFENRTAGFRIDLDFLYYNFDKDDVDHCIKSGILIENEKDEYVFQG